MTAETNPILARKIKCASFDISIYPLLEDLAVFLGKNVIGTVFDFTQTPIELAAVNATMREGAAAFVDLDETAQCYRVGVGGEDDALLSLSPAFVAALSECLLGGSFVLSAEKATPGSVDRELAQMFVSSVVMNTGVYLQKNGAGPRGAGFNLAHEPAAPEECAKAHPSTTFLTVEVRAKHSDDDSVALAVFYFPFKFLEKKKLLEKARKSILTAEDNTQWRADMSANIDQINVELDVTMGSYISTLSELSRLEVDQVIPLDENANAALDIILKTNKGALVLGQGKLGAFKKMKAVKLTTDLSPTV